MGQLFEKGNDRLTRWKQSDRFATHMGYKQQKILTNLSRSTFEHKYNTFSKTFKFIVYYVFNFFIIHVSNGICCGKCRHKRKSYTYTVHVTKSIMTLTYAVYQFIECNPSVATDVFLNNKHEVVWAFLLFKRLQSRVSSHVIWLYNLFLFQYLNEMLSNSFSPIIGKNICLSHITSSDMVALLSHLEKSKARNSKHRKCNQTEFENLLIP